jgi:hypothetical protein
MDINNKDFMKKVYRNFSQFVEEASTRELAYFILDSKFTSMFNSRMRELVGEINSDGNSIIDASVIFNTHGEVALIDGVIIGKYIANNYRISMEASYKNATLNKVVKHVVNGSEKAQMDFVAVSYNILYKTFNELYQEVRCRKDLCKKYKEQYLMSDYEGDDTAIVLCSLLILEDICKYLGVKQKLLLDHIKNKTIQKRYSQEG